MKLAERAIRAGYRINSFEVLGSTNDEAMGRARQGDRGKLWVVAARQTGGRGRQGRSWSSPVGNIHASLLLIDPVVPALAPQIGLVAGVALARAINELAEPSVPVSIKWPNDLVHGGAKLAGILVEGLRCRDGRFAFVLGFGVNRASHPADLPYAATDLFTMTDRRPSIDEVVSTLSGVLDEQLEIWARGRGFEAIRAMWLERALPRGTPMAVRSAGQERTGEFDTIDEQGRLVLVTREGSVAIEAGDVFLASQPT